MQHALVSTLMLPHLTITSVTPDFECLDCKQDGDMGSINMGNQWNPQIVKRVDPMPDSICPGFNFGIVNRGPIRSTSGVTYSVVDASCREAKQTTTQNPCNDPLFSCSPAPIVFTALHLNGLDYACRTDPRAGSCHGEAVQYCCRNDGR
ncbi:hypothetical protein DL96DRAFT_1639725 [Flagelloscypha sp. PMI_526]|nr:hypothetical protein DL96DRAFT_1639725 [Flagelloscypha sp. PMI_526]